MAVGFFFAALAIIHVYFLIEHSRQSAPISFPRIFLWALILGLIYDNTVLALGNVLDSTEVFTPISTPRFFLHLIILPFLAIYSLASLIRVNLPLGQQKGIIFLAYSFTAIALAYGIYHNGVNLHLETIKIYGHSRMTAVDNGPPLATIASNVFAIIFGIIIWKLNGPKWLFIGAFIVFIINSIAAPHDWSFISSNMSEVFFVLCLLKNEKSLTAKLN